MTVYGIDLQLHRIAGNVGGLGKAVRTGAVTLFLSFTSLRKGDPFRLHRMPANLSFLPLGIGEIRTSAWNNLQVGRAKGGGEQLQDSHRNSHRLRTRLSAVL